MPERTADSGKLQLVIANREHLGKAHEQNGRMVRDPRVAGSKALALIRECCPSVEFFGGALALDDFGQFIAGEMDPVPLP